jgi:hypothetical protein
MFQFCVQIKIICVSIKTNYYLLSDNNQIINKQQFMQHQITLQSRWGPHRVHKEP